MCTAIAKKGNDLLYGFNLDVDPKVWNFAVYKTKNYFTVGITVGKTVYFTHGVNKNGQFGNVPYMNGERFPAPVGVRRERIDLMADRYIRGKYSFADLERIVREKWLVNVPAATLHSLFGSGDGGLLLAEPGYGFREIGENYAVLTNFPALAGLTDFSNPFYGKERYDLVQSVLRESGDDFSVHDALRLLYETRQDGRWGTKVSFVWSRNENAVYWFVNGGPETLQRHQLGETER